MSEGSAKGRSVSRREAIKRAAAIGGAVWVTPVIQSVRMSPAFAQSASPRQICYDVKYEEDGRCEEGRYTCLTPNGSSGGCGAGLTVQRGADGQPWTVILPENCTFVSGFSKCGRKSSCVEATASGRVVTFQPCRTATGRVRGISHIELTFCCNQRRG